MRSIVVVDVVDVVVVGGEDCLPLVDVAVAAGEGVGLGILKGVQDGLVLAVEGNAAKKRKIILWQILFRQVA